MKIYKRIENELASLKDATNLTIKEYGYVVAFNGLNSPFVSHQTCAVAGGHGVDELVVFENRRGAWLSVVPCHLEGEFKGNVSVRRLPAEYFQNGFFRFPAIMPGWLKKSFIVSVAIKDGFNGYDEKGTPKFKACISGKFQNLPLFEDSDRVAIFKKWFYSKEQQTLSYQNWHASVGSYLPLEMAMAYHQEDDAIDVELEAMGLVIQCSDTDTCPGASCSNCPYENSLRLHRMSEPQ